MEIKIENLRSLKFEEFYSIKSLNAIVGTNSSGKSTFLRFFPLIKQSIEKQTSNPILWYGPYVDFGSFEESIVNHNLDKEIVLAFREEIDDDELNFDSSMFPFFVEYTFYRGFGEPSNKKITFEYEIGILKDVISRITVKFDGQQIDIINGDKGCNIIVNNMQTLDSKTIEFEQVRFNNKKLLNVNIVMNKSLFKSLLTSSKEEQLSLSREDETSIFTLLGINEIMKVLSEDTHGNIKKETYREIAIKLMRIDLVNINENVKRTLLKSRIKTFNKLAKEDGNLEKIKKICNIILSCKMNNYINIINRHINSYFTNIDYIAPLRAHAERYYRYQNLSVESIDPTGENIPTLINSLKQKEVDNLNEWLSTSFGFKIDNDKHKGHSSLSIEDINTSVKSNITDTGFGFSQIIPILIQLWIYTTNKEKNDVKKSRLRYIEENEEKQVRILIIEQPELHLHPALQAKLIDSICKIINLSKKIGLQLYVIFETHSETIINRIHYNIIRNYIDSDQVNISVFEQGGNGITKIMQTEVKDNGEIVNWPFGFFAPEV